MAMIYSISQPFNSVQFGRVIPDLYQGERSFDFALRAKSGAAKYKDSSMFYYGTEFSLNYVTCCGSSLQVLKYLNNKIFLKHF